MPAKRPLQAPTTPDQTFFVQLTASHIRPHSKSGTRSTVGAGLAREEALTGARNPGSNLVTDCLPHPTAFQRRNPINCGSRACPRRGPYKRPQSRIRPFCTTDRLPHSTAFHRWNPIKCGSRACPRRSPYRRPQSRIRPFCTADCLPHPTAFQRRNPIKCGSGLAREEALTGARNPGSNLVADYLPHPTALQRWNPINVGAGLPAKRPLQAPAIPDQTL